MVVSAITPSVSGIAFGNSQKAKKVNHKMGYSIAETATQGAKPVVGLRRFFLVTAAAVASIFGATSCIPDPIPEPNPTGAEATKQKIGEYYDRIGLWGKGNEKSALINGVAFPDTFTVTTTGNGVDERIYKGVSGDTVIWNQNYKDTPNAPVFKYSIKTHMDGEELVDEYFTPSGKKDMTVKYVPEGDNALRRIVDGMETYKLTPHGVWEALAEDAKVSGRAIIKRLK